MSVQIEERACLDGRIGIITLNAPASINALTEAMIEDMQTALDQWALDEQLCLVLLRGMGERGFCAGGDIRKLYDAMTGKSDPATPLRFFSKEYRLDYTLHRFPKPVIGWGHRVVMGGGLGLLSACHYRLVTPDLIMAMPEISIGLFPDVGASWFLNRLPDGVGLFLGLTGARLNASDALRVGLADQPVYAHQHETLLDNIQGTRWSGDPAIDDDRLYRLLERLDKPPNDSLPASNLARHQQTIARICSDEAEEPVAVVEKLLAEPSDDPWWHDCISTLRTGCPVSAWLVYEQLKRGRQLPLEDIFRMELVMACRCTKEPDLAEGVRARIIEKDQAPQWSHHHVRDVTPEYIEQFFTPAWSDQDDPLVGL
ncbi:MAG: enoyl-CoA hydratase/isomerase family protein [Oleiphilaceae bacterium]|nr:enoyl-CoA hydratase/isomerase family protein [Oleiphilaceae bacterium]